MSELVNAVKKAEKTEKEKAEKKADLVREKKRTFSFAQKHAISEWVRTNLKRYQKERLSYSVVAREISNGLNLPSLGGDHVREVCNQLKLKWDRAGAGVKSEKVDDKLLIVVNAVLELYNLEAHGAPEDLRHLAGRLCDG